MPKRPTATAASPSAATAPGRAPRGARPAKEARDAHAELLVIAQQNHSPHAFLAEALRSIARSFGSPYAAVYVRLAAEVVQDDCHFGATDPEFWKPAVQRLLTDTLSDARARAKLLRGRRDRSRVALLAAPMYDAAGAACGAIALVAPDTREETAPGRLGLLQSLAALASYVTGVAGRPAGADGAASATGGAAPNVAAIGRTAGLGSDVELAFSITNALRNKIGGEQIALGVVRGRAIRILSISGLDEVRHQSPGVCAMQAAMAECLDLGEIIAAQPGQAWSGSASDAPVRYRLHEAWRGVVNGDAVASIPLRAGKQIVAVLSLRRRVDNPFSREELERIRGSVEPVAPALELTRRAGRGLLAHGAESLREAGRHLTAPGRTTARLMSAVGVLAAAWFFFGTMPYRLVAPCTVAPAVVRHIAAPFDGVLAEAPVTAGDRVQRGQTLLRLETRDLEQQLAQLQAEFSVLETQRDRASAAAAPAEAQVAAAQQRLLQTRIDIIRRRLEQTAPVAPFDGVVVEGDLRRQVGGMVQRGQPLLAVTPTAGWSIRVDVPDYAAAKVTGGLTGDFAAFARPELLQGIRIERVSAAAEHRDGKSIFIAEAALTRPPDWLRPGMEGTARIDLGPRRVCWVAMHRAIDWLRLHWWL